VAERSRSWGKEGKQQERNPSHNYVVVVVLPVAPQVRPRHACKVPRATDERPMLVNPKRAKG
jgi:hypothetical protein